MDLADHIYPDIHRQQVVVKVLDLVGAQAAEQLDPIQGYQRARHFTQYLKSERCICPVDLNAAYDQFRRVLRFFVVLARIQWVANVNLTECRHSGVIYDHLMVRTISLSFLEGTS
jgi:hypothetical protein